MRVSVPVLRRHGREERPVRRRDVDEIGVRVPERQVLRRPGRLLAVQPREEGSVGRPELDADRTVRVEPTERVEREVVQRRRRAIDDPVVRRGDRDEMPHELVGVVAAQPLAGERPAEAVADDVDALRAGVLEHGLHEARQVVDVRGRRVRDGGPVRRRRREVALVALVAEPPDLARGVAAVDERLREVVDLARRARCRASGTACRCCRAGRSRASSARVPRRRSRERASRATSPRSSGSRPGTTCPGPRRLVLRPARRPYDHRGQHHRRAERQPPSHAHCIPPRRLEPETRFRYRVVTIARPRRRCQRPGLSAPAGRRRSRPAPAWRPPARLPSSCGRCPCRAPRRRSARRRRSGARGRGPPRRARRT